MAKTEHLILWADGSFDRCATVAAVTKAVSAYAARQQRNELLGSPQAEAWLGDPRRRCRGVTTEELLLVLGCEYDLIARADEMRAAAMLRAAGYRRAREMVRGVRKWRWYYDGDPRAGVAAERPSYSPDLGMSDGAAREAERVASLGVAADTPRCRE